jgi:hypothetical protein
LVGALSLATDLGTGQPLEREGEDCLVRPLKRFIFGEWPRGLSVDP